MRANLGEIFIIKIINGLPTCRDKVVKISNILFTLLKSKGKNATIAVLEHSVQF
jgi:hypothetical protein